MNVQLITLLASLASSSALLVSTPAMRTPVVRGRAGMVRAAEEAEPQVAVDTEPIAPPAGWMAVKEDIWAGDKKATERVEGGQTLKTFKMPPHAERVQYILTTPNGRPVKGKVELWIGPIRCVHELIYDCMNGGTFPLKATLQFKKLSPVLKISTDSTYEFPLQFGVVGSFPWRPGVSEESALNSFQAMLFFQLYSFVEWSVAILFGTAASAPYAYLLSETVPSFVQPAKLLGVLLWAVYILPRLVVAFALPPFVTREEEERLGAQLVKGLKKPKAEAPKRRSVAAGSKIAGFFASKGAEAPSSTELV